MVKFKSISEVVSALASKGTIICADTNILLRMVDQEKEKKIGSLLHQLDAWLEQMRNLNQLLQNSNVGWMIPEQVIREFDNVTQNQDRHSNFNEKFEDLKKNLTGEPPIGDKCLSSIHNGINEKIEELGDLIETNKECLHKNILVMKEDKDDFAHHAWKRVREYSFPNQKKQQMKDSVIFYHLLDFKAELEKVNSQARVCFWTFDSFDGYSHSGTFPPKEELDVTLSKTHIEIFDDITRI